jgi:hypothetical protein
MLSAPAMELARYERCEASFAHFADRYCFILVDDGQGGEWQPFRLWPSQRETADRMQANRLVVILKARQLGQTWLVLAFALWLMLFFPAATVLLFSRRDDEAVDLLSVRLRGMYRQLPQWLRARAVLVDNDHEFALSNGSRVLAFPTNAGDSYTATLAVVDEADLSPDLGRLMRSVKPTIDAGGRMVLLSRPDKGKPESVFKRVYRAAKQGLTDWHRIFLPWNSRPGRTAEWYAAQKADILHRTGSLDDLHEQYPADDAEALAPRTLDKRFAPTWLAMPVWAERRPLAEHGGPALVGLSVYVPPAKGRKYVIGGDPAEGNPTSDDSALCVMDADLGEECATLAGKLEPQVLAEAAAALSKWYNGAAVMCERNNHGHAVLLHLKTNCTAVRRLHGLDGKEGWLSSQLGKVRLYDAAADACRNREVVIHDFVTLTQLQSIDGNTLRAPDGQNDDRADAFALACAARLRDVPVYYRGAR